MRLAFDDLLASVALAHLAVGLACLAALLLDLPPVAGAHPALKPMRFGLSIAVFLATASLLLPALDLGALPKRALSVVLAVTMLVEMGAVLIQAARGKSSHFNVSTPHDAMIWRTMVVAVIAATAAMLVIAVIATVRTLRSSGGAEHHPLMATALRAGLWHFGLAAFTGFAMGGRMRHDVGEAGDGTSVPVLGWSLRHGDLRVAHFIGLHALQILPGVAWVLMRLPLGDAARWSILGFAVASLAALGLGATIQALGGRPTWG